ncbi:MAG: ribosomal protein S18-alanine N-acetyltransferase [Saccharofermentans sp.]|jgi:ribosomal-protein-alanine N-acetyltransferase|nr:ribosomal protein S18-alanine N-acetyltransferase [Mageeibacillus sp.]MCI1264272.1 ribosomal protein S18-alanine N-acetyltransferase [Saccharofermentans sp.]MCI1274949.1 ribosomal protein S18-alanine N-acetyltransferase [Saccharofermentans sp.]MCI1769451.1 ribosomal protein S18-alanine N-acetyltransferase [Mageeibacillus sp.]MCI2044436.1 ribosomal protein S18-alanine N-acetyltransferase [Mageeibacillus sp.]
MLIREARPEDVGAIMELEKGAIVHPWILQDIEALITDGCKTAVAAEDTEGRITGYAGAEWVMPEANIGNIVVCPDCRGQGVGTRLLRTLIGCLRTIGIEEVFLEVEEGNEPAMRLYRSCGFEVYNRRRDYYGQGADALLMKCRL